MPNVPVTLFLRDRRLPFARGLVKSNPPRKERALSSNRCEVRLGFHIQRIMIRGSSIGTRLASWKSPVALPKFHEIQTSVREVVFSTSTSHGVSRAGYQEASALANRSRQLREEADNNGRISSSPRIACVQTESTLLRPLAFQQAH